MNQNIRNLFIIKLNMSMLLTFLGVLFGVFSLYFASLRNPKLAFIFLCFAGMCDGFDGTFANKFTRTDEDKMLGVQFDSLADIFVSGIVPVCILLSMGFNHISHILVYFLFIFCGIYRLSFYNIYSNISKNYFIGFPITTSTIVFPILYLFTQKEVFFISAMMLLSILFILNIKLSKPGIVSKLILSFIGIVIIIYVTILGLR